jgi:hypothetical protein
MKRKHSKKADITAEHSEKLVLSLSVDSLQNSNCGLLFHEENKNSVSPK